MINSAIPICCNFVKMMGFEGLNPSYLLGDFPRLLLAEDQLEAQRRGRTW